MHPLLLQVFFSDLFFMHTVLTANASLSGFVPQVLTKEAFPLGNLQVFLATDLPSQDINPNLFLQSNKLLHHVLSLSVSLLWYLLKGDVPFLRSVVGLKETSPHVHDCNSLLLRHRVPGGVAHREGQSCPLGRAGFQVCWAGS